MIKKAKGLFCIVLSVALIVTMMPLIASADDGCSFYYATANGTIASASSLEAANIKAKEAFPNDSSARLVLATGGDIDVSGTIEGNLALINANFYVPGEESFTVDEGMFAYNGTLGTNNGTINIGDFSQHNVMGKDGVFAFDKESDSNYLGVSMDGSLIQENDYSFSQTKEYYEKILNVIESNSKDVFSACCYTIWFESNLSIAKSLDNISLWVISGKGNLTINKDVTIKLRIMDLEDGSVVNNGTMNFAHYTSVLGDDLINNGTINIVQNPAGTEPENRVRLISGNVLTNKGTINVPVGTILMNNVYGTLNNQGTINNVGAIINWGKLINNGTLKTQMPNHAKIAKTSPKTGFIYVAPGKSLTLTVKMDESTLDEKNVIEWEGMINTSNANSITIKNMSAAKAGLYTAVAYNYEGETYMGKAGQVDGEIAEWFVFVKMKNPVIKTVGKTIKWSKVAYANQYKIYRATSKNGKYKLVKTTTSKSYKATKSGYYKVKAAQYLQDFNVTGYSGFSKAVRVK